MAKPEYVIRDVASWLRENGHCMFAKKMDEAVAEIERLRATPARADVGAGWQPIETAPKEQQPILLALDRGRYGDIRRAPAVAYWSEKAGDWRHWYGEECRLGATPTHWMPLPIAPVGADVGAGADLPETTA